MRGGEGRVVMIERGGGSVTTEYYVELSYVPWCKHHYKKFND